MNHCNQYSYSVSRLPWVSYLGIYWQVLWHKYPCIWTRTLIMLQFPHTVMGHRKIQLFPFINEKWARAWSCFHEYLKKQWERNKVCPLPGPIFRPLGSVTLQVFLHFTFLNEVDLFKYLYCWLIIIQLQHQDMRAINLMRPAVLLLLSLSSSTIASI